MDPMQAKIMALHAADVHGFPLQFLRRSDTLLDGAKPPDDCPNQADRNISEPSATPKVQVLTPLAKKKK